MKNPLVIGYKGEIGSFILNGLLKVIPKALNVWCVDINETEQEIVDRINRSDVIFLCVPLQQTTKWIKKYKGMLQGKIIIEQCSLKEDIFNDIDDLGLDVRSMHILFRPSSTPNLSDRRLGLFPDQFNAAMVKLLKNITQSDIVWFSDISEHDKSMAINQALVHRVLLTLGEMLKETNSNTFIGQKVVELSERIKCGDKVLYKMIQDNRHLNGKLEEFETALAKFDILKI